MLLYNINGEVIGELYNIPEPIEIIELEDMHLDEDGIELIKEFEGFVPQSYQDSVGVWTIGYGTTIYPDGIKVTKNDPPISEQEASDLLQYQVDTVYGKAVNDYTTLKPTQNQYNSLVSFTYNVGTGALKSSTLLKKHNAGDFIGAGDEFLKWVYAGGEVINGLVYRREVERSVYLDGV